MSTAANEVQLPGFDDAAITEYLRRECPGLVTGPIRARLITGGRSNLTYEVTDGRSEYIVRRAPLGHVLATAHDMRREYRVITHLARSAVPVPRTYAYCADSEVTGAPFFVMEKVSGTPYRHLAELEALGPERTHQFCLRMVDTLARLHGVDPVSVGLGDFGRPDGFLSRQVKRWNTQLELSHSRTLDGSTELHRLLETRVPASSRAAIVHGDYRLDNLLINEQGVVTAVLDWEMATIGDPLADVGLLLAYLHRVGGAGGNISDVSAAPGFLSEDEVLERYAKQAGVDLPDMSFYLGLGYFKRAVILETIHFRHVQGLAVGPGLDTIGEAVLPLIHAGIAVLSESV